MSAPCIFVLDSAQAAAPSRLPSPWSTFRLSHAECGGVLDGTWLVLHTLQRTVDTSVCTPIRRTLRHIINPTSPTPPRPRRQVPHRAIHPSQRLPAHCLASWVLCPTVFPSCPTILRPLTLEELNRALDLPAIVTLTSWQDACCVGAPAKLLFCAFHLCFPMGGDAVLRGTTATPSGPSPETAIKGDFGDEALQDASQLPGIKMDKAIKLPQVFETTVEGPPPEINTSKAAKNDDARIPVELWDKHIWDPGTHSSPSLQAFRKRFGRCPLLTLRDWLLRVWRLRITREALAFLKSRHVATLSEREGIRECVEKSAWADWWEWKGGSRLYFWRWPKAHQPDNLKGHPVFVKGPLPRYKCPQPGERDSNIRSKVKEKLSNVREKGYIKPGRVRSLTGYFGVPKGPSDIRMVYDASRSGLNDALWAPNFGLPTVENLLRGVNFGSWMGDIDLGEMFLNFCLDENLHEYCGVDLTPYFGTKARTHWERWVRCLMGLRVSPYLTIKGLQLGLEWILGNPKDRQNPFHWTRVRLNLPGSSSYDPTLPWVSKVKGPRNKEVLAALLVSYVDDLRVAGLDEADCWRVMHHVSSRLSFLGLQFAARKCRPPSPTPGPWAGSVVHSSEGRLTVCCAEDKWAKARNIIRNLSEAVD
jgi:hypothetical protein